ncbi:MAG: class I SAM-dependent methyltransferase [Cucumibacter sp.]
MSEFPAVAAGRLQEDLSLNLERVGEIARRLCVDCADYHVVGVANRATQLHASIDGDRTEYIELVARTLSGRASNFDRLDVLIAGALDTGLLATAARGAEAAGSDILARTRFKVIDRCGTPLELCRLYGERNGVAVTVGRVDVIAPTENLTADLICVHSLFRFLPPPTHVDVLKRFASWLKPGGRIVFSISIVRPDSPARLAGALGRIETMREAARAGRLKLSEPVIDFLARLDRREPRGQKAGDFGSVAALEALFAASGLTAVETFEMREGDAGRPIHRVLALLAPGD